MAIGDSLNATCIRCDAHMILLGNWIVTLPITDHVIIGQLYS